MNELDVATLILRLEQINTEQPPDHWLWDRVMTCDVPRLSAQLSKAMQNMMAGVA